MEHQADRSDIKEPVVDEEANVLHDRLEERLTDPRLDSLLPKVPLMLAPWKLQIVSKGETDPTSTEINEHDDVDKYSANPYPSVDFRTLRHTQNQQFAVSQLEIGIEHGKQGRIKESLACYKAGLDLIPDHSDLWVAKGALEANRGRFTEAVECFGRALDSDPQHPDAQSYLDAVQLEKEKLQKLQCRVASDSTQLLPGAVRGQELLPSNGKGGRDDNKKHQASYEEKYPLLNDNNTKSNKRKSEEKPHRKKEKKKRKKKKRKHRDDAERRRARRSSSRKYGESSECDSSIRSE